MHVCTGLPGLDHMVVMRVSYSGHHINKYVWSPAMEGTQTFEQEET